jgi:hypothetical protein
MTRTLLNCLFSLVVAGCALTLGACASTSLERQEEVAAVPELPRAICVRVDSADGDAGPYGSRDEWREDLTRRLREDLKVAPAVWGPEERDWREADMLVVVTLFPRAPKEPEVDAQGALLDLVTWSWLPLLPWWIADVDVDPGLSFKVTLLLCREMGEDDFERLQDLPNAVRPIRTCLRDRYPALSWATLGALLLPPFVFSAGDPHHLAESISEAVRREVAVEVAAIIKNAHLADEELLKDLDVTEGADGPALVYEARPDLWKVTARLESGASEEDLLPLQPPGAADTVRGRLPLGNLLASATEAVELLRVEAVSRTGDRLYYTIPFETFETSPAAALARLDIEK